MTGLGVGYLPWFPGTIGSLWAVLLYLICHNLPWPLFWGIEIALALIGLKGCAVAERYSGIKDDKRIVWDEIAGLMFALGILQVEHYWIGVGFLFFRIFDIFKPWPIRCADHYIHGGLGIMMDDYLAAGYTILLLKLLQWLFML